MNETPSSKAKYRIEDSWHTWNDSCMTPVYLLTLLYQLFSKTTLKGTPTTSTIQTAGKKDLFSFI